MDISERLPIAVSDDEAGGHLFDRPGRRETAIRGQTFDARFKFDVSGRAGGGVNLVTDIRRKWTEANMITSPAWMLEGRTFTAATGAACGSPQFVARDIRPPPDDGDGASNRRVMLAALAPKPDPRRSSL
jgi:hypothetical protein